MTNYDTVVKFKTSWYDYFEEEGYTAEECIEHLEMNISDESCYEDYDYWDQLAYVEAAKELIEAFKETMVHTC